MGAALATLALLLATAFPQGTSMTELKREYDAIRAKLAVAESREEGRLALQAFVERLSADPNTDAALLYNRAKEVAIDEALTPDPRQRAHWLEVTASAAARTGRPDTALWMQEERARVLAGAGALDEACAGLDAALREYASAPTGRPRALVALADLLRQAGRFDEALQRASQVDALAGADAPGRNALDLALLVRSAIARDVGSPESIEPELEALARSVDERLARGTVDAAHASSVHIELLRVAIAQGDHERVRRDAQALLDDPVLCHSAGERAQVLLHLGASWLELEREQRDHREETPPRARACFEEALQLGPAPADAYFVHTRLAADALERADFERCRAEVQALRSIPPASVPLTTRIEGSVLEAQLALALAAPRTELLERRAELESAWEDLSCAWRSAPRTGQGVAFLKYSHRRAVLSELVQLELALEPGEAGVECAFEHLLAAQELSTLAASRAGEPTTLAMLRHALLTSPRHGLLVYLPARDCSHVFAIDAETITHHALARSSRLEDARQKYVAWLLLDRAASSSGAERAEIVREERTRAAALAGALLPDDVRARVRSWERWSISGTDTLGLVPFEWLPFDGERFLGSRRAVDLVPSIPHAVRTAGTPALSADLDLVLVTDAAPSATLESQWPDLETASLGTQTRAALDATYAAKRMRVLDAERATATEIERVDFTHCAVLQFFVHAVEERGAAVPVALALSPDPSAPGDDGLFRADRIARLRGAPALVVLTACGSGQGPTLRGDPLMGSVAGAWLAHGARAVVAAQTRLTLGEARRTTNVLHAALRGGATPAEALRAVRCDVESAEPELAPFLHAMQQVIGLGHTQLFAAAPQPRDSKPIEQPEPSQEQPVTAASLAVLAIAVLAIGGGALVLARRARSGRSR